MEGRELPTPLLLCTCSSHQAVKGQGRSNRSFLAAQSAAKLTVSNLLFASKSVYYQSVESYSDYVLRVSLSISAGLLASAAIGADQAHTKTVSHEAGSEQFAANYEEDSPGAHHLSLPPDVVAVGGGLLVGGSTYVFLTGISKRRRRNDSTESDDQFESPTDAETTPRINISRLRERQASAAKTIRRANAVGKISTWIVRPEITIENAIDSLWNEHLLDAAQYALKERRFNELFPDESLQ
jgi:hypothetical protein